MSIRAVREFCAARPLLTDVALAALVTAVAATLRLALLGSVPYGLHPDEAQVGLDARSILHGDFPGVYTHAALGQPAGHAYVSVPAIALFGDTVFAVRITLALIAIAAVPLLYALVRVTIGRAEAFFASAMLAVMYWHLLYSRIAHWSISYGTVLLAVLLCLALGMRSMRLRWFLAGGLLLGLGAYTYNIYPIAVAAVTAALAIVTAVRYRDPADRRRWLRALAWFYGVALVVALPMVAYVANPDSYYWTHVRDYREAGLLRSDEFREASPPRKAGLVAEQAWSFVSTYTYDADPDTVDANGQRPVFDAVMLLLLAAGAPLAIARRREPIIILALVCLVVIPLPAVLQRGSVMRQPVAAAPYAALLAALPLAALWRRALAAEAGARAVAIAGVCAALAAVTFITVHDYFGTWNGSRLVRYVYHEDVTSVAQYMDRLSPDAYVYFYSDRHPLDLETIAFLAPDAQGEDRSSEFSAHDASIEDIDREHRVVFVLVAGYRDLIRDIEVRYPGGTRVTGARDGHTTFLAYELAPSASVTAGR